MVAIPAVLESGAETKFCASLLQPNESLLMTVTLGSQHSNITLLEKTSSTEFNECFQFQVPLVQNEDVQMFEVQVRGDTFSSEQARKVMIKAYKPRIFIQTDKPIYLPGQTVHFRVVSLDSKLRSASMLYNIIQLEDSRRNRIGQWLNETSNSRILQLSYSLNSEAHEGLYKITVQTGEDKKFLRFEVEKYVLPKFDVTMHMNVWKGKLDARTDMKGCGTFHFNKSVFHLNQHLLNNVLYLNAAVEEDGTGISHTLEKMINLVTFYGKLSFLDAPKLYEKGSNVEGKVKAVDYDDRPFPHLKLLLFKEDRNSRQLLQNLTTDSNGVAAFSISTDKLKGQIKLSLRHGVESFDDGIPSLVEEELTLSEFLPPSPDTKTSSSLELKKNLCLPCDQESEVTVKYTIVGEAQGTVDVFYLVSTLQAIGMFYESLTE
ncbi:hypothetical protein CCH79_00010252 [Gambusia affinis]|uniref:Alpha-2-macroglobulin bait region domain-containing protein n=1 Tax=Gambusia affinis TaxID=33528 RepID=A0A315VG34_GAMAF|nr:hypothetical protein CCH79_00010252 [Gambusia affinis]